MNVAGQVQTGQAGSTTAPHTVVLVLLSGFRWDYAARDGAKNLLELGRSGVSAPEGMLPSFPAATLPNAWTLMTGLYPGHHGIVADAFFDPARKARFSEDDALAVADGSWYGGVPLWALAEKQGMKAACLAWPGCSAEVAGSRPSLISMSASPDGKVKQIAAWLKLPETQRPGLIAAYFSEVDEAGRKFGPDAAETRAAVRAVDAMIGNLRAAIAATHLPVDLIVVSDHGMAKTEGGWETLGADADLGGFDTAGALVYGKSDAAADRAYNSLKKASGDFVAYRLKAAPANLHLAANPRFGDPVVVATGPYALRTWAVQGFLDTDTAPKGIAGLNVQSTPEMKAIFYAAGPDIVAGKTVAPFENVHVYAWIAHLLGLAPAKNDGSLNLLSATLRDGGNADQQ
jgi:alkaline phosphatase D